VSRKGSWSKKVYQRVSEQKLLSLKKLLTKIDQTGSVDRKPGSGKRRTIWIAQNVDSVEELVLSQESAPGTHKTIRQIVKETGISKAKLLFCKVHFLVMCFKMLIKLTLSYIFSKLICHTSGLDMQLLCLKFQVKLRSFY